MNETPIDRFIQITDVHIWRIVYNPFHLLNKRFLGNVNVIYRRRKEFVTANLPAFSQAVADTGVKTVLITGDFTSTATKHEFAASVRFVESLEELGLHVMVIPGNHDVYTFESVGRRRYEHYLGQWEPGDGLPTRTTLPGGTPLILVPTCCPNLISSKGRISDRQAEHVAELIAACGDRPVVVSGHYPVLNETYGYSTKPDRRLRNAEALRQALGTAKGPLLYVAGHVHRFSLTRDAEFANVQHLTTGAFVRRAHETDSDGEFSEIHIGTNAFHVCRHLHRDTWELHEATAAAEPAPRKD